MGDISTYTYGPVPSRRLGNSLGVDVMPFKVCTMDCVYCQLGRSTDVTIERKEYVAVEAILAEVKSRLAAGLHADFITIGGSGEPTLNSGLGRLIDGIKHLTEIPVAVLTNGTLLSRADVRRDCGRADVVLPSLDAFDEVTFRRLNRAHGDISFESHVGGLCEFRREYSGRIWLEVFLIEGINTAAEQIEVLSGLIERIRPDKVHLNTAVRPTADAGVERLSPDRLGEIAGRLGPICEIVADISPATHTEGRVIGKDEVLSMLRRRPCTLEDISSGLGIERGRLAKYLHVLERTGGVSSEKKDGTTFYSAEQT